MLIFLVRRPLREGVDRNSLVARTDRLFAVALYARAWIEIRDSPYGWATRLVALYARAWIEIAFAGFTVQGSEVALYARAWIEIFLKTGL